MSGKDGPGTDVVDDFGRTTRITSPLTGITDMLYNEAGALLTRTDARNITLTNTYDEGGRLTAAEYNDGVTTENTSYDYDAGGRRILAEVVGAAVQTYTHDRRGQVLTETLALDGLTHETAYTYTLDGALDTVTYPSGRVVDYTPDFAGRPTAITSTAPGGGVPTPVLSSASYLPFGPPTTLQLGPPAGQVDEAFAHDWQYRRTAQSAIGSGPTSLLDLGYGYDPAGNLTDLTDALGNRDATYGYDDLGRLTSAIFVDGTRGYEYDAIGNVERLAVNTGLPGEGEVLYTYDLNGSGKNSPVLNNIAAYDEFGTPLWSGGLATDPAGNVETDGASTYDYDVTNHLGSRQLPSATVEYDFTAGGRNVRAERLDTLAVSHQILDTTGNRLARLEGTSWRDYVWLGGRLLGFFDDVQADATIVFANHIGMPVMAVDGLGAKVWEAKAEPYGQLRGTVNTTFDPGLRYPGQWQDAIDLEADCLGNDCTFPGPLERSFCTV